jgi:hypothetical protein
MPWVAPVRRSVGGDTGDSNATTRQFTVQANAGDLVCLTVMSSDYRMNLTGVSGGGIGFTTLQTRNGTAGYGAGWVIAGTSPTTQTFTLTCTFTTPSGAYYHQIRWYVFGSHGGIGYSGAWRGGGEAWFTANQTTERSAFIHAHVDWNVTAPNGSWILDAGPVSDGVVFRGGAGIYWAAAHLNSFGFNQKNLGAAGASSTRLVGAGMEIKGIYVDTSPPATVPNITATPLDATSVRVNWTAPTDDVGVTAYRVYDNGVQLGADIPAGTLTYTHTGLAPESTHQYTVRALDAAGNISVAGTAVNATTFPVSVNKAFLATTKPSLRLGTNLVRKLYVGTTQVWP